MEDKQNSVFDLVGAMREHLLQQYVDLVATGGEDAAPNGVMK